MPHPTDNQPPCVHSLTDGLQATMTALKQQHRYRSMTVVNNASSTECVIEGQRYINFCSNHYLGDAEVASHDNTDARGAGSSRLIVGTSSEAVCLEKTLAALHHQESALLFSSGYQANIATLTALVHKDDLVLFDKHCHASLIDGIRWSGARWQRYGHLDMADLEIKLQQATSHREKKPYRYCWIVTDTLFSMDGDVPDLSKLVALAEEFNALVYLDEAHAVGVYGDDVSFPAGLAAQYGLSTHPNIVVTMGSLSKALGSLGGYVAGSTALTTYLVNHARGFIYSTALPPALISGLIAHLEQMENTHYANTALLWNRVNCLKNALKQAGLTSVKVNSPIVPVMVGDDNSAIKSSALLKECGLLVQPIRYPTVPKGESRLRISLQATHSDAQLQSLVSALKRLNEAGFLLT